MENGRRPGRRAALSSNLQEANVLGCYPRDVLEMCPPKTVLTFGRTKKSWGAEISQSDKRQTGQQKKTITKFYQRYKGWGMGVMLLP